MMVMRCNAVDDDDYDNDADNELEVFDSDGDNIAPSAQPYWNSPYTRRSVF